MGRPCLRAHHTHSHTVMPTYLDFLHPGGDKEGLALHSHMRTLNHLEIRRGPWGHHLPHTCVLPAWFPWRIRPGDTTTSCTCLPAPPGHLEGMGLGPALTPACQCLHTTGPGRNGGGPCPETHTTSTHSTYLDHLESGGPWDTPPPHMSALDTTWRNQDMPETPATSPTCLAWTCLGG
jgi:hypothetical protein